MIEVGNNPDSLGAVIVHSTESGQFLGCTRLELERLAAAVKRGDLDAFLGMRESSVVADGDPDWTTATPGRAGARWRPSPSRGELMASQDDCLLAIEDGNPVPVAKLAALPPWRAVMVARIAARAGVPLERGTADQLHAEARAVGDTGTLGSWWTRGG